MVQVIATPMHGDALARIGLRDDEGMGEVFVPRAVAVLAGMRLFRSSLRSSA